MALNFTFFTLEKLAESLVHIFARCGRGWGRMIGS